MKDSGNKTQKIVSLRTEILFRVITLIVVLMAVIAVIAIISGRRALENTVKADLNTLAQTSDHIFSTAIKEASSGANPMVMVFESNSDTKLKQAELLMENTPYQELAFIDKSGNVQTESDIFSTVDLKSMDCVQKALSGTACVSSSVKMGDELRFITAVPCGNGALALTLDKFYFSDLISEKVVGKSGNIFMIDNTGTMIANIRPPLVEEQQNFIEFAKTDKEYVSAGALYARMVKGESGIDYYDYKGLNRLCAFGPVSGSDGWSYGVAAPVKELTSEIFSIVLAILISAVVLMIIGIVWMAMFSGKITKPIINISKRMTGLAHGDLSSPVESVDRSDEIGVLSSEFGETVTCLRSYIKDMDSVLSNMAEGNFRVSTNVKYAGEFSEIAKSLNTIIQSMNDVFNAIHSTSDMVTEGANSVAESSQNLASGASNQSAIVQKLVTTLEGLSQSSERNSSKAFSAKNNAVAAGEKVKQCDDEMQNAADAMIEISDSAKKIQAIISTIEDIAFQTNILALNASIEAARAGEAGKGFGVVADEVRTLANKSDKAAKQTKTLIEDSISAVSRGAQIVNNVSEQLGVSTDIVLQAVEDMKTVSVDVHEENNEIVNISESITQIDAVVQQNTAAGEENASVAQTLLTQAEELKRIMKQIKLKGADEDSFAAESV